MTSGFIGNSLSSRTEDWVAFVSLFNNKHIFPHPLYWKQWKKGWYFTRSKPETSPFFTTFITSILMHEILVPLHDLGCETNKTPSSSLLDPDWRHLEKRRDRAVIWALYVVARSTRERKRERERKRDREKEREREKRGVEERGQRERIDRG